MISRPLFARLASLSALALAGALVAVPSIVLAQPIADALRSDDDVTWGVRTASNEFGAARSNFSYAIEPGDVISDAIVIANHGEAPLALDVYAADAFTTESGQLDVLPRAEESVDAGLWVSLDSNRIALAGAETVEVPFTITVPEDATPGDYAAGIVTSLAGPNTTEGIDVDRRLGVRIHFRIGGILQPSLVIEDLAVDYATTPVPFGTGSATLRYTVRNDGNVRLTSESAAATFGPLGWFRTDAIGVPPVPELLPGESWEVEVPIDGVPPTFWVVGEVTLQPVIPPLDGSPFPPLVEPVVASSGTVGVPWGTVVLLLVLAAAVVFGVRYARGVRTRRQAREAALVAAAVESALREREANEAAVLENDSADAEASHLR